MTVKDYGEPLVPTEFATDDWLLTDRHGEYVDSEEAITRAADCVNAFAGLDPADSVVVSVEDAKLILDMSQYGLRVHGMSLEAKAHFAVGIDRISAAIERKGKGE